MTTHTYPEGTLHDIEELCPCTTAGRCSLHAAAPDMLAALEAALCSCPRNCYLHDSDFRRDVDLALGTAEWKPQAYAAITKATEAR